MADSSSRPDTNTSGAGKHRKLTPSTPRWVFMFGIIAIVLIVMVVAHLLLGGHGPGHHMLLSSVTEHGE